MQGIGSLDGPNETLNALYGLSRKAFRDITTGANSNYTAGPGYDLVTGRGSPVVWRVVAGLVAYRDPTATTFFAQSSGVTRGLSVRKQESPFADLFSAAPIL